MLLLSPPPLAGEPRTRPPATNSPRSPTIASSHSRVRAYLLIFVLMSGCWLAGEILAWFGQIESPLRHLIADVRYASFYFVMMFAGFTLLHLGTRPAAGDWRAVSVL